MVSERTVMIELFLVAGSGADSGGVGELKDAIKTLSETVSHDVDGTQHEIAACIGALHEELQAGDAACKQQIQDLSAEVNEMQKLGLNDVEDKLSDLSDKIVANRLEILGDEKTDGENTITQLWPRIF